MNKVLKYFTKSISAYCIITILVIIINGIYFNINCFVSTDEFSALSAIAELSGNDWSACSALSGYHGFGALLPIIPLFKINSTNIYLWVQLLCLFYRILCSIISYEIVSRVFEIKNSIAIIICVLCNFGMLSPDDGAALSGLNEVPITLICLIAYILLYYAFVEEKIRFYCYFAIVTSFGSLIHSRILIMYASSFICISIMSIFKKIKIKQLLIVTISFAVSYILFTKFQNYVNLRVYQTNDVTELVTTTSGIVKTRLINYLAKLFYGEQLKIIFTTIFSQLASYTFYSFGMIWVFIILNIKYIYLYFIKRDYKDKKVLFKNIIVLWGILNFFFMIISISISCTGAVNEGNYRWLTYLRYSLPYAWILVLNGLCIWEKEKVKINWFVVLAICVFFVKYQLLIVCPMLDGDNYGMSYSLFNRFFYSGETAYEYFVNFSYIMFFIIAISALFIAIKREKLLNILYLGMSLLVYVETFLYFEARDKESLNNIAGTNSYIESNIRDEETEIYIVGEKSDVYNLQLKNARMKFVPICSLREISNKKNYIIIDLDDTLQYTGIERESLSCGGYVYEINDE